LVEISFGVDALLSLDDRSTAAIDRIENKRDGDSIAMGRIIDRQGLSTESIHANFDAIRQR
jgi:hypothetical protein